MEWYGKVGARLAHTVELALQSPPAAICAYSCLVRTDGDCSLFGEGEPLAMKFRSDTRT